MTPIWLSSVGFIKSKAETICETYIKWIQNVQKRQIKSRQIYSSESLDRIMQPVKSPWNKALIIEIEPEKTALVHNDRVGYGCIEHVEMLSFILKLEAVFVTTLQPKNGIKSGITVFSFEYFGIGDNLRDRPKREIVLECDYGKWSFRTTGTSLPFEKEDIYSARKVRERFSSELVINYLSQSGFPSDYKEKIFLSPKKYLLEFSS